MPEHMTKAELLALDKKLAIAAERLHIADYIEAMAVDILYNKEARAVDGYVAAAMLELSKKVRIGTASHGYKSS